MLPGRRQRLKRNNRFLAGFVPQSWKARLTQPTRTAPEAIVQEKNAEGKDEIVQKSVVGGEDYADLPGRDDEEANDATAARKEKHPGEDKLESESAKSAAGVKPARQMLCVPADPGG